MTTLNIAFFFFHLLLPFSNVHGEPTNLFPFLIVYKNGTVKRDSYMTTLPFGKLVPPISNDLKIGVSSKDIIICPSTNVSARLYLPKLTDLNRKCPIFIHFHGGAFCIGSAFCNGEFLYLNKLSFKGNILVVSVNYRLFPEHQLPIAYIDAWSALKWVAYQKECEVEPWLFNHGDFNKIFIGGDSSGANIAHHLAMRARSENLPNGVKIYGAILATPFFYGSKPLKLEPKIINDPPVQKIWGYVCPSCEHGLDNPYLNPFGPGAPSLKYLSCKKLMVYIAEKDFNWKARGIWYYKGVKASGWEGKLKLYKGKGMFHAFHIIASSKKEKRETLKMIERVVKFIKK